MKKILSAILIVFSLLCLNDFKAQAQTTSHLTKVGAGILYGDEPESVGIQINGTYRLTPQVAFAPDVSIYFPDNHDTVYDGYWALNLNGHYIFSANTQYSFYGIGGLNITTVNYRGSFPDDHDTKLGINIGIGGEYHLQDFSLFGELKYIISDLNQVVIGVGARVPIK